MKLVKIFSTVLALVVIFSGCSNNTDHERSEESSSPISSVPSESSVVHEPDGNIIDLKEGDTFDLKKYLSDSMYEIDNFSFKSEDDSIATVSADGIVKAVKSGSTKISAADDSGKSIAVCTVNITENTDRLKDQITPAVWEVTDDDGNIVYMMGSIHVADESVNKLPDYFESAYRKCDSLAVECDTEHNSINIFSAITDIQKFIYSDNDSIRNHISAKAYENAENLLIETGNYSPLYYKYKPAMWEALLEIAIANKAGLSSDYGFDSLMIKRASSEGKNILELESIEFQMNMLMDIPEVITILELESYSDDETVSENIKNIETLYDQWKNGTFSEDNSDLEDPSISSIDEILTDEITDDDIRIINMLLTSFYGDSEKNIKGKTLTDENSEDILYMVNESIAQYNKQMLYDRNEGMAEKALEYMRGENVVFMVAGSAHFYGEKGILKLMENYGCNVRRLTSADNGDISSLVSIAPDSSKNSRREQTDPGIPKAA